LDISITGETAVNTASRSRRRGAATPYNGATSAITAALGIFPGVPDFTIIPTTASA